MVVGTLTAAARSGANESFEGLSQYMGGGAASAGLEDAVGIQLGQILETSIAAMNVGQMAQAEQILSILGKT